MSKTSEGISLDNLVRKRIHYTIPYPLPSLQWVAARSNMTAGSNVKYSNCICYNFFIFCPICMKFSHNILHTYSFILGIIKHNWKIRRFWVADPLKTLFLYSLHLICQRQLRSFKSSMKIEVSFLTIQLNTL